MLYIITALKPEAQPFIERYKLQKSRIGKYTFFENSDMRVIISGVGSDNAMMATQTFINHFDITDDDIYANIGVCGASHNYPIGEVLDIATIIYNGTTYPFKESASYTIETLDKEANSADRYDIVDMESFGFYEAIKHSPAIKHKHIIKIVSDHFEPSKVTKASVKMLISHAIESINSILYQQG